MKKIILGISFTLLFSACSKVQELDERTKNMEESTRSMQETTDEMSQNTTVMYKQKRQLDSLSARDDLFQKINDKNIGIEGKLSYASKFYKAFEYQLWNNESFDTEAYREELLEEAMKEYLHQTLGIYNFLKEKKNILGISRLKRMSPLKVEKNRSPEASFYALAATMHINNRHQDLITKGNADLETFSIYDVITTALLKEKNGQNMPRYMESVITGKNKELAIELLKARFNFLVALAVSDMTIKDGIQIGKKTQAFFFKISGGKLGKIKLDIIFDESNTVTQKQINQYLLAAINTRAVLQDIAVDVKMDKTLRSAISNIDTNEMVIQASQTGEFIRFQNYILKLSR